MTIGARFTEMFGVELPIIQAPMAGSSDAELAVAVAEEDWVLSRARC